MDEIAQTWCPTIQAAEEEIYSQLIGKQASTSLCQTQLTPLIVTGMLRQLLVTAFSNPDNIREPILKKHIWTPGDDTGILIKTAQQWDPRTAGKKPAIILKRNSYKHNKLFINDRVGITKEGFERYNIMWSGSHTVFCLAASSGAAAELLSVEVALLLVEFAPVLRKSLMLSQLELLEVGDINKIKGADDYFGIPVNLAWAFQRSWTIETESLKLRAVDTESNVI